MLENQVQAARGELPSVAVSKTRYPEVGEVFRDQDQRTLRFPQSGTEQGVESRIPLVDFSQ